MKPPTSLQRQRRILTLAALGAVTVPMPGLRAQEDRYPARPVKLIVPLGAGGSTDILARLIAPAFQEETQQALVVENRPGAEGIIGAKAVASAAADGYTLLMGTNGTHVTYAYTARVPAYDPVADFEPVTPLLTIPIFLWTGAESPWTTLAELVGRAKERPGSVTFGTNTNSQRLLVHMLSQAASVQVLVVPFKSNGAAMLELAAGRIDAVFTDATASGVRDRVRPLAVMAARRVPTLPAVPTILEAGADVKPLPVFFGIWAPPRTPPQIVDRLNATFAAAMKTERVREFLAKIGAEPLLMGADAFRKFHVAEIDRAVPILRASGIQPQ